MLERSWPVDENQVSYFKGRRTNAAQQHARALMTSGWESSKLWHLWGALIYKSVIFANCHKIILTFAFLRFSIIVTITVESRDFNISLRSYAPLCMLALGKSGEGAYRRTRDPNISVWRPLPNFECHVGARALAVWWGNSRKTIK